jgi:putative ATP-binding cassette transporter
MAEFGVLAMIVVGFCAIAYTGMLTRRTLALAWRDWIGQRLTVAWLAAGGRGGGGAVANVDGRIAEDARVSTEEAVELFSSLLNALITLGCFVGVLWALSAHPPVGVGGVPLDIPGYLLWLALLYTGAGMVVTMLAARPLVRTTDHRQAMEADYRAALVRTRDSGRAGLADGPALMRLFGGLARSFHRQSFAFARLELFVCWFTRFGLGLPFLIATPAYLAGVVTLGWVMQAAQAFQTVSGALSWPITNMPRLSTWRASAERVLVLHEAAAAAQGEAAPAPRTVAAAAVPKPAA